MATGIVKWWSEEKGFGFITPDNGSHDVFVHHTGILGEGYRSLREGQRVSFDVRAGEKGPIAEAVVAAGSPTPEEEQAGGTELYIPGLVDPNGTPLTVSSSSYLELVSDVRSLTVELLNQVAERPNMMFGLTPGQFEELVAELLAQRGYSVELSPGSREFDIRAAKRDDLGSFVYLVECKRWAPDRPVPVNLVRELHGITSMRGATAGMIATTSRFTRDAQELQEEIRWKMSLKDFFDIKHWLAGRKRR